MTIRKKWILTVGIISVISIIVNSLVLSLLTSNYFNGYLEENYQKISKEITSYLEKEMGKTEYSSQQIQIELETYLGDSITEIKVYDNKGNQIATAEEKSKIDRDHSGMMSNMMERMSGAYEVVEDIKVSGESGTLGEVHITRYSTSGNSYAAKLFQVSLIRNSLISTGVVIVLVLILGFLMSKKVSRDLIRTAEMADNINMGKDNTISYSGTKEIRIIQERLESLETRLKLKQKARKTLVDEMIHQTRTPLTILKMHLEGVQDGVIEMIPEEIKVCEDQIDNLSDIITNIGSLIEAKSTQKPVNIEEVEISQNLKQILRGMSTQFQRKKIELKLLNSEKLLFQTDKYLLGQSIYNILNNAYKFTPEHGKVMVDYKRTVGGLQIEIEDTGCGISQEYQNKIFDPYFKKATETGSGGDGIGLYVAKENIQRMGGSIQVESKVGAGSKFLIHLPNGSEEEIIRENKGKQVDR